MSASSISVTLPAFFSKRLFANLTPEELEILSPKKRQALASQLYTLAQTRKSQTPNLRLAINEERHGWACLEIINDDMPFLVTSLTNALTERNFVIERILHPIFYAARDAKGELENLPDKTAEGLKAESFIRIDFSSLADGANLTELKKSLLSLLADIRAAVTDWPQMIERMEEAKRELSSVASKTVDQNELTEAVEFLSWLAADHFNCFGYRDMVPVESGGRNTFWEIVPDSGFGILRADETLVFGDVCDMTRDPKEIRAYIRTPHPISITKASLISHIHRGVPLSAIFIKQFDEDGKVVRERLFVGLFTSTAYRQDPFEVPLLRRKSENLLTRANIIKGSHDCNVLSHILATYPRDELFEIDEDTLFANAIGIMRLRERSQVALFARRDPYRRFATCLIYVPRENYNSALRDKIETYLSTAFQGKIASIAVWIDEGSLARFFATIATPTGVMPDTAKLELDIREICRTWKDGLYQAIEAAFDKDRAAVYWARYRNAFPAAYQAVFPPQSAIADISGLEMIGDKDSFAPDISKISPSGQYCLKLLRASHPILLSEVLPLVENMGLKVAYMHKPQEIVRGNDGQKIYLHAFVGQPSKAHENVAFTSIKPLFEETLRKVWAGELENDPLNGLALTAGLAWREIWVLRALIRYLRQLRTPYSLDSMVAALVNAPTVAKKLIALFHARLDPRFKGDRKKPSAALAANILAEIASVPIAEEERTLRRCLNLVQSMLRTNYYQMTESGTPKPYMSFKFDSRAIEYMPLPKPLVEIFVYSSRFEAVHLRGGKVARGGIRWSDLKDDYRNEILGLMKAQMVKNSVIVPVGSKGGFVLKKQPAEAEKLYAEGVECYRMMMRGLLDLTDNRVKDKIVTPRNVVRYDEDDPYLVVAADKGTAKFSDIANGISSDYGFWLGDAFASGGSAGYDHKAMGITARGAWEAVKRHFREIGKDIQKEDFTCIGIGDMSGDVFGNGMLLSKHTRLMAAFDHRHIFLDPNPDAATSHAERKRLFDLPRSSWADYDVKKLSKGGGIYPRNAKSINLTPEVKKLFGLTGDSIAPNDLIQVLLRADVELIYFGGIGTYIKASEESNETVADRPNNAIRINGKEVRAKIIGEGANLGLTQRGRIEYAMKGGKLNTDAIDNSAGVDTSDHEVNIKILLSQAVESGRLTIPERNKLLASMTGDVAKLVLRDNYRQTLALSIAHSRSVELLPAHIRTIRLLEKTGLLNRKVEFLPDDETLMERQRENKGLTRPELAVLLSYSKIWLYDELMKSTVPDDDFLHPNLIHYFPEALQKKFADDIDRHRLRREIVATYLTNSLVNRMGCHFVPTVMEQTGRSAVDVARTYMLVRAAFDLPALWQQIKSLDNVVALPVQMEMLHRINRMVDNVVPWFLTAIELPAKLNPTIDLYLENIAAMMKWLSRGYPADVGKAWHDRMQGFIEHKVPPALADRVAKMPYLAAVPNLVHMAQGADCSLERVADISFGLSDRLKLEWLRRQTQNLANVTTWQREAIHTIVESLFAKQRVLVTKIVGKPNRKGGPKTFREGTGSTQLAEWLDKTSARLESYDTLVGELQKTGVLDLSLLTLLNKQLENLAS
jgi:glutamate dehydrogenase